MKTIGMIRKGINNTMDNINNVIIPMTRHGLHLRPLIRTNHAYRVMWMKPVFFRVIVLESIKKFIDLQL